MCPSEEDDITMKSHLVKTCEIQWSHNQNRLQFHQKYLADFRESTRKLCYWKRKKTDIANWNSWSAQSVILLVVLSLNCFGFCIANSQDFDNNNFNGKNNELVKSLWGQLRQHELAHIFGKHQEVVPNNVDIISPVIISHRKIKRRKTSHKDKKLKKLVQKKHVVQLHGLGRAFTITLNPNPHLVQLNEFVHLVRHENHSDILPDEFIKNQLGCFYHGDVQHSKKNRRLNEYDELVSNYLNHSEPEMENGGLKSFVHEIDVRTGRVAVDICKGMSGFIVPSDNDPEHYYVIHPIPTRLQAGSSTTTGTGKNPHFLWQKQTQIMTSMMSPFKNTKDYNHVHQSGQKDKVTSGTQSETISTCGHDVHLHDGGVGSFTEHIANDLNMKQTMNHEKHELHKKMSAETKRNRVRRSPTSYIDDGQFHYKPLSIASDSYWLRYRTTASPTVNQNNPNNGMLTSSSSISSSVSSSYDPWSRGQRRAQHDNDRSWSFVQANNNNNNDNKRESNYNDQYSDDSQASNVYKNKNQHDWAKGILVYETASPPVTEQYKPKYSSTIPFYSTKRQDTVGTFDEQEDDDGILKRSTWLANNNNRNHGSDDRKYGRYPNDTYKSQWASFGSPSLATPTVNRKGRRDDSIFGDKWYTSLDYTSADSLDPLKPSQSIVSTNSERQQTLSASSSSLHNPKELSHLTIETAVFIDKDLYKHMQANFPEDTHGEVARIVLAMINAVQLLYQDPSLGHRVDFVLKRLEILESDPVGLLRPLDIDRFLTNFCKWQKTENPANDAHFLHWDHALILTGLDLYVVHQSGKISNQVVGLAPVAGMCTRSSSCTVNEGRHFESVYVVAHEIGHNLGMRHDGPQADNDCDPSGHIMSPTLGSGKISWSPCSKRYLDMFLETSQSKCLLDKAKSESRLDHESDGRLPGERFDSDKQCVLKYGTGSFHAEQQPIEDVCRDLHCRKEHYTWTSHPALEGTFCGLEMWCRSGKCVPKLTNLLSSNEHSGGSFFSNNHLDKSGETAAYSASRPIQGGWGKFSPYTDCSSACLYTDDGSPVGSTGIRLAARRCDSPRPEHGGVQCFGLDRRYKTCSIEKICPYDSSKTSVTQYANEVCTRAATVDTELSGRGFMTNTNDPERACSVWCETLQRSGSRSRGWSFPDGTHCKLASHPDSQTYCIAGKCQDFTCDSSSHFVQSDEICNSKNNGRPSIINNNNYEQDHSIPKTWFHTSVSSSSISSSISSVSNGNANNRFSIKNPNNHENEVFGWTNWETHSNCKLSCLAPAKGLELVQRHCNSGENQCGGVALSVRLCKPNKTTILANGCTRIQTPFEYATKICSKYSHKVNGLSGIGMQLSPTKDDVDRPCHIGCQDSNLPYRFYMVNGEEGWFPSGTDCSRGEPNKKAFCLSGKCVEFGHDDTPMYRMHSKLLGRLEPIFRVKRDSTDTPNSHSQNQSHDQDRPEPTVNKPNYVDHDYLDQSSLRNLVEQFTQSSASASSTLSPHNTAKEKFDFSSPVVLQNDEDMHLQYEQLYEFNAQNSNVESDDLISSPSSSHWQSSQLQPLEGSFYEWRKVVSDCSVTCGSGIQEIIVQCISGETIVNDSFCSAETRPGVSGYSNCTVKSACESNAPRGFFWTWLEVMRLSNYSNSNNTPPST